MNAYRVNLDGAEFKVTAEDESTARWKGRALYIQKYGRYQVPIARATLLDLGETTVAEFLREFGPGVS